MILIKTQWSLIRKDIFMMFGMVTCFLMTCKFNSFRPFTVKRAVDIVLWERTLAYYRKIISFSVLACVSPSRVLTSALNR